jgi:hypothetical protein
VLLAFPNAMNSQLGTGFSLKTWEETTVKEFTSLNSKENQIFFAIWFV